MKRSGKKKARLCVQGCTQIPGAVNACEITDLTPGGGLDEMIICRHFFVRECVENLQLVVPFVRTHENLADFFTKPLEPKKFFELRNAIMNYKRQP